MFQLRYFIGSTALPFSRISKWQWLPVESPVLPTSAMVCPFCTVWPVDTNSLSSGHTGKRGKRNAGYDHITVSPEAASRKTKVSKINGAGFTGIDWRPWRGGEVYAVVNLKFARWRVCPESERRGNRILARTGSDSWMLPYRPFRQRCSIERHGWHHAHLRNRPSPALLPLRVS